MVFDSTTGFMRGRLQSGAWRTPFDPVDARHWHAANDYTEGNAWQYTWYVPHDVPAFVAAFGGRQRFLQRLDSLFITPTPLGQDAPPDITGLIGQYAHGNEPSHHIAYLFSMAGAWHTTRARVRQIAHSFYSDQPDGLCGNEDCGQLSAWYLFSALGFYPVDPASGHYVLGTPLVAEASLTLPGGRALRVRAVPSAGGAAQVRWRGQVLSTPTISHADLMRGGELRFELPAAELPAHR
jgi:predicted alpha-1,2-mannosidase